MTMYEATITLRGIDAGLLEDISNEMADSWERQHDVIDAIPEELIPTVDVSEPVAVEE